LVLVRLEVFQVLGRIVGVLLDVIKELQKGFCVVLKHSLRAVNAKLAHLAKVGQTLDLCVFGLVEQLGKEDLTLFFFQLVTSLLVFGPFSWHREVVELIDVHLCRDFGTNCDSRWLDIGLLELL
jgi:hypothetical protein